MSSAQGVVERASAELTKRINGLGLRSKHHSGKTSVMERVTNALCGGSSHNSSTGSTHPGGGTTGVIEKSSRLPFGKHQVNIKTGSSATSSQQNTPQSLRKFQSNLMMGSPAHSLHHRHLFRVSSIHTIEQLFQDEKFLEQFFLYFTSNERKVLAQVCTRWRDILYRNPRSWTGLIPVLPCRDLRRINGAERTR